MQEIHKTISKRHDSAMREVLECMSFRSIMEPLRTKNNEKISTRKNSSQKQSKQTETSLARNKPFSKLLDLGSAWKSMHVNTVSNAFQNQLPFSRMLKCFKGQ